MASIRRSSAPPAIVRLWLLRLVARTTLVEQLEEDWPDPRLCSALGIGAEEAANAKMLQRHIESELEKAESQPATDDPVSRNLELLAERLNLTETERSVLALAAYSASERALSRCLSTFDEDDEEALHEAIAVAIGVPLDDVSLALHPDGTLRGAELLRREHTTRLSLGPLLLAPKLGRLLRRPFRNVDDLLAKFFSPVVANSQLEPVDFPHVARDVDVAVRLLRGAADRRATGINLLLHGPPGTGKTELARMIAKLAGCTLYEVAATDDEGDAAHGSARLAGFALCQRSVRAIQRAIVLFDEVEDVFPRRSMGWGVSRETGGGKAWLNRALEQSAVPSIWIGNSIDHVDPSYVRRFAFVLEVPEPPTKVRRRMLGDALGGLGVSDKCLERLAERKGLTPAHIQQARTVLNLVAPRPDEHAEQVLELVLDGTLSALDDSAGNQEKFTVRLDLGSYSLGYVNPSIPLEEVVQGLKHSRRATILLSGPPGTGKTAFVAHLQEALEMPVVAKRVSDLVSCWLGETEKNLAAAFRQAKREGAILFLDEADSLFQSRERAVRSWELTQVNELLTQMEAFEGIMVCATNFMDTFDPASMRRFELKIRFEPLTTAQRAALFVATLRTLMTNVSGKAPEAQSEPPIAENAAWRAALARLSGLTPGDYGAAARRLRLLGVAADPARLLAELEVEQQHKPEGRAKVAGFRA